MNMFTPTAKKLWRFAIAKDILFSTFVFGTVLSVQIGFLNGCYCGANVLTGRKKKQG